MFKKGTALVPSFLAFAVVNLLVLHFPELVDYAFTAQMEDALDDIARGEAERVPWLSRFYFGPEYAANGAAPNGALLLEDERRPRSRGRRAGRGRGHGPFERKIWTWT